MKQTETDTILVVGAGLTGLTTAFQLIKQGRRVIVIDRSNTVGGQIKTHREDGFIAESGPNTGVISYPEVAELFEELAPDCYIEIASEAAKCRLIWKGNNFHPIPSNLISAIETPLFSWIDKLRILIEPFRKKGNNPNESVADLVRRRLGKSFLNYAVDPFLAGVYAGNPETLITRHALPKLYKLEQTHGSFIMGAFAKLKEKRTIRDKKATKKVFSAVNGLDKLTSNLANRVGSQNIVLNATNLHITPNKSGWTATYMDVNQQEQIIQCHTIVSTVGAYSLPELLPFLDESQLNPITQLVYAAVIQVSVGFKSIDPIKLKAFGGLVPSIEKKPVLGILFPSSCFHSRSPVGGALFSFFLAGKRNPELFDATDKEIEQIVLNELNLMLHLPASLKPSFFRIFRHNYAIPQYELSSNDRLQAIEDIQTKYENLYLAGNIRDGIGLADRIKQACDIANTIKTKYSIINK